MKTRIIKANSDEYKAWLIRSIITHFFMHIKTDMVASGALHNYIHMITKIPKNEIVIWYDSHMGDIYIEYEYSKGKTTSLVI
jgi:hypothetical protein